MGRTITSIVQAFHQERESWGKFRRALGRSDREAFDRLFQHARQHAAEASYGGKWGQRTILALRQRGDPPVCGYRLGTR